MFLVRVIAIASPVAALRRAIRLIEEEQFAAAFPLLTRAAKAGIPEAEYHVARSYLEGAGVPRSQAEGARWLERAEALSILDMRRGPQSWITETASLTRAEDMLGLALTLADGSRGWLAALSSPSLREQLLLPVARSPLLGQHFASGRLQELAPAGAFRRI